MHSVYREPSFAANTNELHLADLIVEDWQSLRNNVDPMLQQNLFWDVEQWKWAWALHEFSVEMLGRLALPWAIVRFHLVLWLG